MKCLPRNYRKKHDYSIAVYNQIVGLFKTIEQSNALNVKIPSDKIQDIELFKSLHGDDLYNWLKENDLHKEIFQMEYKQCFAAILTDMLQFLLTALNCSEKGQLNVTFALLRKPLKDSLFYLEHLIAFPKDFIAKFNSPDNINSLAVDKRSPEEIKRIIELAIQKVNLPIYSGEVLYSLRFNKKFQYGFEPAFQQANHLITKHEYYRTEDGNFNFIFSNKDDKKSQWDFIYNNIPTLLLYLFAIVTEISSNIVKLPAYWPLLTMKYMLGNVYITNNGFQSVKKPFKELFEGIDGVCDSCKEKIIFDAFQFKNFQEKFSLKCKNCKREYSLMK